MRRNSIAANPVLIGAATALVVMVAVFLSYNANSGLPFVPTYNLKVELPSAANLVAGNEVRIGANRVGIVSQVDAKRLENGRTIAGLSVKIEDRLRPLPKDTTSLVRFKSALGLKYLELTRCVPGPTKQCSSEGLEQGDTIPLAQSSEPVEFDEAFSWADEKTRKAAQQQLVGVGDALAGRGAELNTAIAGIAPLLDQLRPVAENLSDPSTKLSALISNLGRFTGEVAPVADDQAQLFVNLDATFSAFASVARPYLQDAITEWPVLQQTLIDELPGQRPFIRNSTKLFAALRPGTRALAENSKAVGDSLELSGPALKQSITLNERLRPTLIELKETASEPIVQLGVRDLRLTTGILDPLLAFLTPAQTVCNYGSLVAIRGASTFSVGDSIGTAGRFQLVFPPSGPNNQAGPAAAPANGGGAIGPESGKPLNYLRQNPYPNTAAPGQTRECEAGNVKVTPGKATIGNVPGNQGTNTEVTTSKLFGSKKK
jgi:ABC-type transporter Mla subunit MlaD